jgi:hypothetical protein
LKDYNNKTHIRTQQAQGKNMKTEDMTKQKLKRKKERSNRDFKISYEEKSDKRNGKVRRKKSIFTEKRARMEQFFRDPEFIGNYQQF